MKYIHIIYYNNNYRHNMNYRHIIWSMERLLKYAFHNRHNRLLNYFILWIQIMLSFCLHCSLKFSFFFIRWLEKKYDFFSYSLIHKHMKLSQSSHGEQIQMLLNSPYGTDLVIILVPKKGRESFLWPIIYISFITHL